MSQPRYMAPVIITARDRPGLIRDIATVVSDVGVNMMLVNSRVGTNRESVVISTTLEIDGLEQIHRLFARLEKVKDVVKVERDLGKSNKA
jgi:GTP pyrophosphokinase